MGCVGESQPGTSGWQPFDTCAADEAPYLSLKDKEREERQYKLRLRGLDEIWRDFVEYFKLITLQKISSWQQRNHGNRKNRPKEINFSAVFWSYHGNKRANCLLATVVHSSVRPLVRTLICLIINQANQNPRNASSQPIRDSKDRLLTLLQELVIFLSVNKQLTEHQHHGMSVGNHHTHKTKVCEKR